MFERWVTNPHLQKHDAGAVGDQVTVIKIPIPTLWVNSSKGSTKENRQFVCIFWIFAVHAENGTRPDQALGPMGPCAVSFRDNIPNAKFLSLLNGGFHKVDDVLTAAALTTPAQVSKHEGHNMREQ